MKKVGIAFILVFTLLLSCSKNKDAPVSRIAGTWIFTNQFTNSYAYPSFLTNPFPLATSGWSTALDSVKIIFDDNGNYTFVNFNLPVDKGRYVMAQDSFLIIKPDTAGFVKFNYSLSSLTFSSGTTPVPVPPYADFKFSSDTILFKKIDDKVIFSGRWITKAKTPVLPGNDTLILNQSLNYFKRR